MTDTARPPRPRFALDLFDVAEDVIGFALIAALVVMPTLRAYDVVTWPWWVALLPLWFVGVVAVVAYGVAGYEIVRSRFRRP